MSKGKDEYELPDFRGALLLAFPGGDSTLDKIKHIHAPQIALFEFLVSAPYARSSARGHIHVLCALVWSKGTILSYCALQPLFLCPVLR